MLCSASLSPLLAPPRASSQPLTRTQPRCTHCSDSATATLNLSSTPNWMRLIVHLSVDGSVYEGQWKGKKKHGLGTKWRNGKLVKCGRWENNKFKRSRAVPLRRIPVGKWLSDAAVKAKRKHPNRSALLPSGSYYVGQLNAQGQPDGRGTSFRPDGSTRVRLQVDPKDERNSGRWVNGKLTGRATQVLPSGARYEGSFKDGKREGLGAYIWKDGSRYEGEWVADRRNELGAKWDKDGKLKHCGRWEDGKLVEECAVPLRLLPDKRWLSAHAKIASLLFPDGGYFVGPINARNQRHGFGRMFNEDEVALQSGKWIKGKLQRRMALIIGCNKYASPLKKLHCCNNDAIDMQSALKELDFDCTLLLDPSRRKMTDAITAFIASLQPGDLVFIFISSHGAETDGNTYLLPTDFKNGSHQYDAVGLNSILRDLNRKDCNLTSIIVLDCCRADDTNVTFRGSSSRVKRSVRLPTTGTFFIVKSSDPGTVAHEDRGGRNGWFTGCLLRYLTEPDLRLTQVFGKTGVALKKKSKGLQRSWIMVTDQFLADDLVLKQSDDEE